MVRADDLFVVIVSSRGLAAYSFVVGLRRTGSARDGWGRHPVGKLDDAGGMDRLTRALRRALQDPSLELNVRDRRRGALSRTGRAVPRSPAPRPVAALVHDEALLEDPGLVSAITATVRLTVDNERLRRELQARLDELDASRARIIAAGDQEPRAGSNATCTTGRSSGSSPSGCT